MKIVVGGWGITGDVYPVVALAERLLERGHQGRICTLDLYRDRALAIGAEFYDIGVEFDLGEFHAALDADSESLRYPCYERSNPNTRDTNGIRGRVDDSR